MAKNGACMFEIVHRVCLLHPVYYISTAALTCLFVQAVNSCDRGKGCVGKVAFCIILSIYVLTSTACLLHRRRLFSNMMIIDVLSSDILATEFVSVVVSRNLI